MLRGELYLVARANQEDPRRRRAVVVVSRNELMLTAFASVVCAPVYSRFDGIGTQVVIGESEGLPHQSAIFCDNLLSIPKAALTNFVGSLDEAKLSELDRALAVALGIDHRMRDP